jgi:glucose-6-phosphate 1-dehydrogenase
MTHSHVTQPTAIVIFGGTGDLAKTKLFPALLDLYVEGKLPHSFVIIGLSRKELSDQEYQSFVQESIKHKGHSHDQSTVADFCSHIRYVAGSFDDKTAYEKIKEALTTYDQSINQCTNKLFYLAVPPQYYEVIFDHLSKSQAMALCDNQYSWSRLLVEKPFGRDLKTAQALEKKLCSLFADEQVYRIDHYLAKDAIENIVALRFVNSVLADSWNGEAIESVDITLLETKDVSNRGSFYDAIGTLRDVGQNHLLQIFALLTMPLADIHDPQAVRDARASALKALEQHTIHSVVRGQYAGYADTTGVAEGSDTETYFSLSFSLDNERWRNTRFTLEAGKALDRQVNEAIITFRPHNVCHCGTEPGEHQHRNVLTIQFAPKQHISLSMWTKLPGFTFTLREQVLTLVSDDTVGSYSPEAYERVLHDCIIGDQTRFVSSAEVESSWQFITPILEHFKKNTVINLPIWHIWTKNR